jgi:hypothetical protein
MLKKITVLSLIMLAVSTTAIADDANVYMECEDFPQPTVTGRWLVKNKLDYAIKYTYKEKASGPKLTILVPSKQSELLSNFTGVCALSSKPTFVSYVKY